MSSRLPNTSLRDKSRHEAGAPRRSRRLRTVLLATSALASVVLTPAARADDATWTPQNNSGNFNDAGNWSSNAVPDDTGTATFNDSTQRAVSFSAPTIIGGISAAAGAGDYTFAVDRNLTLNGTGISVGDGASAAFTIHQDATMLFLGTATAGSASFTNNWNLNFGGSSKAGIAQITNGIAGIVTFLDGGSADHSTIVNNSGRVEFYGSANAANATITNNSAVDRSNTVGAIRFFEQSNAGQATIISGGLVTFADEASGGTARLIMTDAALSVLDISKLSTSGMTIGSLDGSGNVFLGGSNLSVGGNGRSTAFAGVIQDGASAAVGGAGGTGGSLTKEGTGALMLSGTNAYTGATSVTGGALVVDGSIATSSGVTVGAGGTLAGIGTVSSTTIQDGGALMAGHGDAPFGALTVQGNLTFAAAATYLVQVSPGNAGRTDVRASATETGSATLGGATVQAKFAKGVYVTRQYDILNAAGGVSGTFGALVSTNLSPMFKASLRYGTNDVFLDVQAVGPDTIPGLNLNQRNVAKAIVNSYNTTGGISAAFATLSAPGLTQVSGETAVGSQQATFDAMGQFMGVMLDPTGGGRSGGAPGNAYASMPRKAPVAEAFNSRWGVWAAGFGGSQSTSGDAVLGSNKTTSSVYGSAVGADYRISPNTVAGFALAGGGTHFNVANGGSGQSDLFQAGTYLRHTQGAAFIAAALAYGWQDVTTNRTVTAAGFDSLRGRFNSNALSGRLEGGYRIAGAVMDVTPYAAGQFINYRLPSYTEQVASGANTFALAYGGKDVTASRTELGLRTERAFAQDDASLVTLRGRLAWAHDFNTDRNVQAVFVTLPGSAFTVNGAQAAADTALTSLSAEVAWRSGWAASATFDGQFSDTTKSYAGKGVVRYAW